MRFRAFHTQLSALLVLAAGARAQDTTVVKSTNAAVWKNVRLVEELRIGVQEGADEYIVGSIGDLQPMPDGSIFVVDGQGPRLRLYDARGKFVRQVMRKGAGPGEYGGIMGVDLTPDGRLAVWDLPNTRVNLYKANGDYDTSFRAMSGWWGDDNFKVDASGRYWVYTSVPMPGVSENVEGPGTRRGGYLLFSPQGQLMDTVFAPEDPRSPKRVPGFVIMAQEGGLEPFPADFQRAFSPKGYFVTEIPTRYAIDVHSPPAAATSAVKPTIRRIERTYTPVRLGREEKSQWEGRATYYDKRGGPTSASYGVKIPDVKPAFRYLSVDEDGSIWVDRYVAARERTDLPPQRDNAPPRLTWREPRTFDVFEPAGRFLGSVSVPNKTKILYRKGSVVWAVNYGESDESYVVKYRLVTQ